MACNHKIEVGDIIYSRGIPGISEDEDYVQARALSSIDTRSHEIKAHILISRETRLINEEYFLIRKDIECNICRHIMLEEDITI